MSNQQAVQVAIGLGSNLAQPLHQLSVACRAIQNLACTDWLGLSDAFFSRPQGPQDQPDFVNAVCLIRTCLSPTDLLLALQMIEQSQGRVKQRHWGERVIDLDILLYGDSQISSANLVIPHPQLTQRDFVLIPLAQVWPDAPIGENITITDAITGLPQHFITRSTAFTLD